MTDFFRTAVNEDTFIRGAARLMWAGITVSFPTSISQIVNLSTYDAMTNWYDLGATKGGVAISRNSTEETFDVDQILANIDTRPVTWDQTIATAMAEASLDRINIAWEAGSKSTSGGEETMGVGDPTVYKQRRLAVLLRKDDGKLRAHVFRKVVRNATDSTITLNKTGDQITFPITWTALADTSITDVDTRTQVIFNQV
jgi:hypothetical protein